MHMQTLQSKIFVLIKDLVIIFCRLLDLYTDMLVLMLMLMNMHMYMHMHMYMTCTCSWARDVWTAAPLWRWPQYGSRCHGGDSVGLPTLLTAVPKHWGEFLRLDRAAPWVCGACQTVRHRPGPDRPAGHTHSVLHGGFPEAAQSLVGSVSSALSRLKREVGD